ncbi:hypothetical protein [Nesterenkonia muleiensis]|uniref:hypothetical protein n=1 Tax=Nesterenkonia muleiensis TaxID=2282648 RepID=UPI000E711CD0|nr:hypothetical protein [Nesterenkonia muleiensis]
MERRHESLEQELMAVDMGLDQLSNDQLAYGLNKSISEAIVASVAGRKLFLEIQQRSGIETDLDELLKPVTGVMRLMQEFSRHITEIQTIADLERRFHE